MNKLTLYFLAIVTLLFSLASCTSRLDKSLEFAGENRKELEAVLEHFEDDPNPLKYEAAKFLIENMPYHYTYNGDAVNMINNLYVNASKEAHNIRTAFFDAKAANIRSSMSPVYDIKTIKAEYLIKAINDACDMWCNLPWHEMYDKETFFNYVLPYRIEHEPLSDWRKTISEEFPLLTDSVVLTRRGMLIEGENAKCIGCIKK